MWPCGACCSASASSDAIRSSSVSPMPTRIPLVNGIFSSPAAAIVSSRRSRVLGRRTRVHGLHQPLGDRLEHQALRSGDLSQAGEVLAAEDAEVGVRQDAALERALAGPDHVRGEVLVAVLGEPRLDPGVDLGLLAGQHEQLLDPMALGRLVEDLEHLVGVVQVRLVGLERAVLAIALARRDSDSVRLRLNVTRRRIRPADSTERRPASPAAASSRSSTAAPSRAIRERGITRSKPASRPWSRTSASTCE